VNVGNLANKLHIRSAHQRNAISATTCTASVILRQNLAAHKAAPFDNAFNNKRHRNGAQPLTCTQKEVKTGSQFNL